MNIGDKVRVIGVLEDNEEYYAVGDTGVIIDCDIPNNDFLVEFFPSPTVLGYGLWWVEEENLIPDQKYFTDVIERYKQKALVEREEKIKTNYRIKYIRRRNRRPYGVFTSIFLDGKLHVGWSLCNRKDKWDKAEGRAWANRRAATLTKQAVPASIAEEFKQFIRREKSYYRVDNIENIYFVEMELAA
jgi:hypothetical protein